MKIITEKESLITKAGEVLNEMFANRGGKKLLMLLSGGSSLPLLEHVKPDSISADVTIGMLDDRYTKDRKVNGTALLKTKGFAGDFYTKATTEGAVFFDSYPADHESLEMYGDRYEALVKKWIEDNPDGIIRATVGIGPDGHTSGVLPHPEDPEKFDKLFNGERLVIGYDVGNKSPYQYRMTSTFTLMRQFDQVLTFMSGDNKKEALQKVMAEEGTLAETPGRIAREFKNGTIFTDIEV